MRFPQKIEKAKKRNKSFLFRAPKNKSQDTKQSLPSAHLHLIEIILSYRQSSLGYAGIKREKAICIVLECDRGAI